jgi:hypothetical protein
MMKKKNELATVTKREEEHITGTLKVCGTDLRTDKKTS